MYNRNPVKIDGIGIGRVPNSATKEQNTFVAEHAVNDLFPLTVDNQLRTVFIGSIPFGMSDTIIQNVLDLIPGLVKWARIFNTNNVPGSFGFARFENATGVKIALEILGKVELPTSSSLKITCEENTKRWIESQEPISIVGATSKSPHLIKEQMSQIFRQWTPQPEEKTDNKTSEQGVRNNEVDGDGHEGHDADEGLDDFPEEERIAILEDISKFRKRTVEVEKAKRAADERYERERQKKLEKAAAQVLDEKKLSFKEPEQDYDEKSDREYSDEDMYSDEDDEKLEQHLEDRKQERLNRQFEMSEKRWLSREKTRASALEREKNRDETFESRIQQQRQAELKKLAEYRDNSEHVGKTKLYYYDHSTWLKQRTAFRSQEIVQDRRDAELEKKEVEKLQEKLQREEEERLRTEAANKPVKISLSGVKTKVPSAPHIAKPVTSVLGDEEEQALKKPSLLPSFSSSSAEQEAKLKALEQNIPESVNELFAWDIKWDSVEDAILEEVIRPSVISNVVEYLGVQEEDLINFIMDTIKSHKPPQELVSELEMTLDEDAQVLTQNIWRLLILESERKYQNI